MLNTTTNPPYHSCVFMTDIYLTISIFLHTTGMTHLRIRPEDDQSTVETRGHIITLSNKVILMR